MKPRKCNPSLEGKIAALNESTPKRIDQLVTAGMDSLDAEFKVWDELFGVLAWKFTPTDSGDMAIDAEQVYNELKDKFELKRKPIER